MYETNSQKVYLMRPAALAACITFIWYFGNKAEYTDNSEVMNMKGQVSRLCVSPRESPPEEVRRAI